MVLEKSDDPSAIMMSSSICALVFDLTSEEDLLNHPEFSHSTLERLSQLIIRSLSQGLMKYESNAHHDLLQIIRAGYDRWAHKYPFVRNTVERVMKA